MLLIFGTGYMLTSNHEQFTKTLSQKHGPKAELSQQLIAAS